MTPTIQILNTWVRDRKDRKKFNDPVTALEWATMLKDFSQRARYDAANLAAHNWDITIIGDRLLCHSHWSKGHWWEKGAEKPATPMTDAEQAALHEGKPNRYGDPPAPNFEALVLADAQ